MITKHYIAEVGLRREAVESFDRYPFSLAAVRPLERLELHPAVTFFVGENGSGKSTLLEAIAVACGFNAEGGSKNFRFDTRTSHSELHRYLLDEPEAALSPSRQLSVITRVHDLVQEKSQFIIATHSPILMAYPQAYIYAFSPQGIERVAYEETEHYRVTRDFLSNPQRMLRVLLAP